MKVSDLMTKQLSPLRPSDKIEKAAFMIFGKNIKSIPICEGKKLVGLLTEGDILRHFQPTLDKLISKNSEELDEMKNSASVVLSFPISKLMNKNPITISLHSSITQAYSLMNKEGVEKLLVTDDKRNLMGLISKGDVFKALIGAKALFTENEDYNDFLSKTYYSTVDWDDRLKKEIPDLVKLLKKHNVKTVLDVGCGTGEYSIELAKRGFTVVGTDRSTSMIEEAKRRKVGLSTKQYEELSFMNKDTEDFLYDMDIKFDAILIMGNALSHNPENYRNLLKKSVDCLSDNGLLIIQTQNFEKILKTKKRLWNINFVPVVDDEIKEYCFVQFYDKPDRDRTILKTFAIMASDGQRWNWSGIRNSVMAYTNIERIESILKKAGISKIDTYGGSFDGRTWDLLFSKPFRPLESDWLNIVATKN